MSAAIDWVALGSLAAAAYTIIFTVSVVLLWWQIREVRRSRDSELLMSLYDRIVRAGAKRQRIYESEALLRAVGTMDEWDELRRKDPDLSSAVAEVSMDYHLVGLFLHARLLAEHKTILNDIGLSFLHVFGIIERIVAIERQRSGATYRGTLEKLRRLVLHAVEHE
jgi:hypothetical protein